MNKLIYTSFSPNTRLKDIILNFKLLLSIGVYSESEQAVLNFFAHNFKDAKKGFLFNYARSGMYVLFKSLNLPEKSEVLMQGFTCSAAVNPILWTGLTVKYVDVDTETGNMLPADLAAKITTQTKVVLFQHAFGNSSGIEEVSALCATRGLILIEDCTNTILGKCHEKLLGSYGAASIFSFGRDKAVSGVSGGAILLNDSKLVSAFSTIYDSIKFPPKSWTYKELVYPLIWSAIKKTFTIKLGKVIHLVAEKLSMLSRASTNQEKAGIRPEYIPTRMPSTLACLAAEQFKSIDEFNQHRLKLCELYTQELAGISQVKHFKFDTGNTPLRYPLLVENRTALVKFLQQRNIYVGDWYSSPITPVVGSLTVFNYSDGECPNSEKLCTSIINLPTHINTSVADADKIIHVIKEFYGI